jgi:hypothetical protein
MFKFYRSLYKILFYNLIRLVDHLIVILFIDNCFKFYYIIFEKCVLYFNQARACALRLGSMSPLCLSSPHAFTNSMSGALDIVIVSLDAMYCTRIIDMCC